MKPTGKCRSMASVDMKKTRYFMELTHCTGDGDPYTNACPYCLTEDGCKPANVFSLEEIQRMSKYCSRCESFHTSNEPCLMPRRTLF